MEATQLGPFDLCECIGEGGMGKVFRAVHRESRVPAAIKVIRRAECGDSRERFHREVQAHAGLAHPGVVYLFDYGVIDAEVAARSRAEIVAGSPYVVMELADHGTVRDLLPLTHWNEVRPIVLQVLDALAATHARGIIHRDLKPENFLAFRTSKGGLQIKLADFGIAHAMGPEHSATLESQHLLTGTVLYMPPEQLRGYWRLFGPWTDLYALGCIVWEMVCGKPPFWAESILAIALQHSEKERPPLDPIMEVPKGLQAWVHRAMAVDETMRFQHAADAARMLPDRMPVTGSTEGAAEPGSAADGGGLSKVSKALAPTISPALTRPIDMGEAPGLSDGGPNRCPQKADPVVPDDWRRDHQKERPARFVDAGLGLFGLRSIPFVDRDAARDQVWETLGDVVKERQLRCLYIHGERGTGASELARWMTTRAREVGAVQSLKVTHEQGGDRSTEGLAGMVRSFFRVQRLERTECYEHLLAQLPPLADGDDLREPDARALTELIDPLDDNTEVEGPRYQFTSPEQKSVLMTRFLRRVGRRRMPLVWIDDLQWGIDALGWLEHLCRSPGPSPPALIVATVRTDLIAGDDRLGRRLDKLQQWSRADVIELDSLDTEDHRELVDRLLPLEPELGDLLAQSTEGNPLFARQLVGHWVSSQQLEVGPQGFTLRQGCTLAMPDDIHEVWTARLASVVCRYSPAQTGELWRGIEVAAALGQEVSDWEWHALCERAGWRIPDDLVDRLAEAGLVERRESGFAFTHGMLVDSIARHSREAQRWSDLHRHCAQGLEALYPERRRQTARRRATHWMLAGRLEMAVLPLNEEFDRLRELGDFSQAEQIRVRRQELLEEIGVDQGDARRIECDIHRAFYLGQIGDTEAAERLINEVSGRAKAHDDTRNRARAHALMGVMSIRNGDIQESRRQFELASKLAADTADRVLQSRVERSLGWSYRMLGNAEDGISHFRRSYELAQQAGDRYRQLEAVTSLAIALINRGEREQARQALETMLEDARAAGFRKIEINGVVSLGDIALFENDYDRARQHYEEQERLAREIGQLDSVALARLNGAQVELYDGDYSAARRKLDAASRLFELIVSSEWEELRACINLALSCAAQDWAACDRYLARRQDGWSENAYAVPDHARLLEWVADRIDEQEAGGERAWGVRRLACDVWTRVGNDEAVARLNRRLKR